MCKVGRQRFECLFIPKEGAHRQRDKKSWLPWKSSNTNCLLGALRSFSPEPKLMLHGCQSDAAKDVIPFKIGPDHEYAHLFHFLGDLVHNLPRGPRIDISRTLLIKHESQRISSASRIAVCKSTLKVRRSRLFTPIRSHPASSARFSSSES